MQNIIEVVSGFDLYNAGYGEDGEVIGHRYFVQIEASNGRRFQHVMTCKSVKQVVADDGYAYLAQDFEACEAKTEKLANAIRSHLANGGKLDSAYWIEVDPAYGSEAYQELDNIGFFKKREKALDQ